MAETLTVKPMQFFDQDVDGRFECETCHGSCWIGFDKEQRALSKLYRYMGEPELPTDD